MIQRIWRLILPWGWLLICLMVAGLIWLLPIEGSVLISSLPQDPSATFPQYTFNPTSPKAGDDVLVTITDNVPWTHVELTVNGEAATFVQTQALPARQQWNWTWRINLANSVTPAETARTELAFYRDCETGCRLRDTRTLEPYAVADEILPQASGLPTKLCVAFPDPTRNWYGRSGWGVELTYATTDVAYWQIDALSQRVMQNVANGTRVLVRVDYASEQSLPPEGNQAAVDAYLAHIRRLARDERLQDVYAFVIGTGFNALDSNNQSTDNPTTPLWYATLFNGLADEIEESVVRTIRTNNPTARVLVGPVRPWIVDQSGSPAYATDAPWLNYMNELVDLIDDHAQRGSAMGLSLNGPDGFALNVPGRPSAVDAAEIDPALEPTLDVSAPTAPSARGGFQIYQEWLAIINSHPATRGKPVYITSTNTFAYDDADGQTLPSEAYPAGWLTNALQVVNQEAQIESLCWFLDLIPDDQRWEAFSLSLGKGRMSTVANEFNQLLQK